MVIEVQDLHKSFRVPSHRAETLKERMVRPFTPVDYRVLNALRGLSFQVPEGELLGIVGRNGCGKTTLLKLLASVYRADSGRIRVAGSLAPFIELGVGFNPNLTARENVLLNGVMMGLTPRQAKSRFDQVIEFAGLEEFVEMKLKNYSSGMHLRLAFSMMIESDADVMLVDEVLAVGDASFARKCLDTLQQFHSDGRTILFVTHAMESMQSLCDRAILIEDGVIDTEGEPEAVAQRYLELNFTGSARAASASTDGAGAAERRIADAWVENSEGERVTEFEQGAPIEVVAVIEAREETAQPTFAVELCASDRARVFSSRHPLRGPDEKLEPGDRVRVKVRIQNPLAPDSYLINCAIWGGEDTPQLLEFRRPAAEFVVRSARNQLGYVELDHEWEIESERRDGALEAASE